MLHIRPYQRLVVWQEAHALCLEIYTVTSTLPADERFRIVDQMCRSAASVPTNIAEGSGKRSRRERSRFYETALMSLEELHYQCLLSRDLDYLTDEVFTRLDDHIQRVSYLLTKLRLSAMTSVPSVTSVPSATPR